MLSGWQASKTNSMNWTGGFETGSDTVYGPSAACPIGLVLIY